MCGVFGFVAGSERASVDVRRLERVALEQQRRGVDAFGFAWLDRRGRVGCWKQIGPARDWLAMLRLASAAVLLIGHTRMATRGEPADRINNHPHASDGGWIVHNGTVRHFGDLADEFGVGMSSDCDSEILARLVEVAGGGLLKRCAFAAEVAASRPLVLCGLWPRPGRLVTVRDGNPLCFGRAAEGWYFGSLPGGLPGRVESLPDRQAVEWRVGSGMVRKRRVGVAEFAFDHWG